MNSKENLDTSERGTLVPPHPQNGIKNTEMPTSQPTVDNCHWENPRICCTCQLFENCKYNGDPYFCEDASEPNPCPRYTPMNTD